MTAKYAPFTIYLKPEDISANCEVGHRNSVVSWRLTDKAKSEGKTERHPVIVSIPSLEVKAPKNWCLYQPMQAALNEMQDAMVTEAVNSILKSDTAAKIVGMVLQDLDVSETGIAAWHANKAMNGKLSGETIKSWFAENLADNLGIGLIEAGIITKDENDKLTAILADFQTKFVKLASPKATMPEGLVKQMQKALAFAPDDKIKAVLGARLQGFLKPAEEAIAIAW